MNEEKILTGIAGLLAVVAAGGTTSAVLKVWEAEKERERLMLEILPEGVVVWQTMF